MSKNKSLSSKKKDLKYLHCLRFDKMLYIDTFLQFFFNIYSHHDNHKRVNITKIIQYAHSMHLLVYIIKTPAVFSWQWVNTLRPRENGCHFADNIFKYMFFNENILISINISRKFVPEGPISNKQALVQIMAWRRPGDKPLSEPMLFSLHICVSRSSTSYHSNSYFHIHFTHSVIHMITYKCPKLSWKYIQSIVSMLS